MAALDFRGPSTNFHMPVRKPVPATASSRSDHGTTDEAASTIHPDTNYSIAHPSAAQYQPTSTLTSNNSSGSNSMMNSTPASSSSYPPRTTSSSYTTTTTTTTSHALPTTTVTRSSPATSPYIGSNSSSTSTGVHPLYKSPGYTTRHTPTHSTTSSTVYHTPSKQQQQQQQLSSYSVPTRTPSNVSSKISRTSSTRSGASLTNPATSYVALMRKQKATVWCDRSQHQDPRLAAAQKAAKMRAVREIQVSGSASKDGRTSTGVGSLGASGVRSKIRHHGVPKASGMGAGNMHMIGGGGVPMRLSANEVGDEDESAVHSSSRVDNKRSSTGRDSLARSAHYLNATSGVSAPGEEGGSPNYSLAASPGSLSKPTSRVSHESIPEESHLGGAGGGAAAAAAGERGGGGGHFDRSGQCSLDRLKSVHSSTSTSTSTACERENSFGQVGTSLATNTTTTTAKSGGVGAGGVGAGGVGAGGVGAGVGAVGSGGKVSTEEELRRRGSVDERANTMTLGAFGAGGRLFVANPDVDD